MNTIFVNSKNNKTSDPHRLLLNLTDKIDLKRKNKYIAFSNLSIYYAWKNIKKSYKDNKTNKTISAPTWNEEFELPDGVYSISDIQHYFQYILKRHGAKTVNPSIRIYINEIENRTTFKIKTGYCLKLLNTETTKLLGSTKSNIAKNKNSKNLPYLEIKEVVLIHSNVVNNSYQQNSRVLCTFVPNKWFGQLLDISSNNFTFLETFDSEFAYIEVCGLQTKFLIL